MTKIEVSKFWFIASFTVLQLACQGGGEAKKDAGTDVNGDSALDAGAGIEGDGAGTGVDTETGTSTSTLFDTGTSVTIDTGTSTSLTDTDTIDQTDTATDGLPADKHCSSSADCSAAEPLCHPLDKVCVECLLDVDCASDQLCRENRCVVPESCDNSLDCAAAPGEENICDTIRSICVDCLNANDCEPNHDCIDYICVPYAACVNSLDCPSGTVCDVPAGRCRECLQNGDCERGEKCVWNNCVRRCNSDNDCTPLGMLCNMEEGYCVRCLRHADCPTGTHCRNGDCVLNFCVPGRRSCTENTLVQCTESGAGFETLNACGPRETCVISDTDAQCRPWICTPGETECDDRKAVTCSADGFSVTGSIDCELSGEYCVDGACNAQLCEPNGLLCVGGDVARCAADGLSTAVEDICNDGEYCDDSGEATCAPQVCSPNSPACNDDVATLCNEDGSGYQPGGTTCQTPEFCSNGACTTSIPCGNTVCPGASCVEFDMDDVAVCAYLADKDSTTTRADAISACSALGIGWSLCSRNQICRVEVFGYLAEGGCHCNEGTTSCSQESIPMVLVHASDTDMTDPVVFTNRVPGIPPCAAFLPPPLSPAICQKTTATTSGAVLCCN